MGMVESTKSWRGKEGISYKGKSIKCVYLFLLSNGNIKVGITSDVIRRIEQIEKRQNCKITRIIHTKMRLDYFAYELEQRVLAHFKKNRSGLSEYLTNLSFDQVLRALQSIETVLENTSVKNYKHLHKNEKKYIISRKQKAIQKPQIILPTISTQSFISSNPPLKIIVRKKVEQ